MILSRCNFVEGKYLQIFKMDVFSMRFLKQKSILEKIEAEWKLKKKIASQFKFQNLI